MLDQQPLQVEPLRAQLSADPLPAVLRVHW